MSDIRSRVQSINPDTSARNLQDFVNETGNIYKAVVAMSKRANALSVGLKNELTEKLEEFASSSDTIEEIQENKEQIEISKFYERLPNSSVIAITEFLNGELGLEQEEEDALDVEDSE